jgi:membrane protein required for colicin V production
MNIIDVVILILLLVSAVSGFIKGFVLSIASFVGFFLGIIVSFRLAGDVQQWLMILTGAEGRYLYFIGFLICFAVVVALVFMVGKILEKAIELVALGLLNRIAGAAFGMLKTMLIFSALIYALSFIDPEKRLITTEQQESSLFYQPLENLLPAILPFIRRHILEMDGKTGEGLVA